MHEQRKTVIKAQYPLTIIATIPVRIRCEALGVSVSGDTLRDAIEAFLRPMSVGAGLYRRWQIAFDTASGWTLQVVEAESPVGITKGP